jgi:hypothetical protein
MSFWWPAWRQPNRKTPRSSRSQLFRPTLEVLEDRLLLSTFTVLNVNDGGPGSLRQAILDANSHPNVGGPDVIAFNIAGSGAQSIALSSALPNVTDAVVIDATTQPGYSSSSPHPVVELNGAGAGGGVAGLVLSGSGITVRALAINRFNGAGVVIVGSGDQLQGDYIGTDVTGTARLGNGGVGVALTNGATGNFVGGSSAGQGNVIAANGGDGVQITGSTTSGNFIQGNFIGTDATGTVALNNAFSGVAIFNAAHDNLVGGATAGARNLISGNGADGVFVGNFGSGPGGNNTVQGNYIGTDVTGTHRLGNGGNGVKLIDGAFNNLIGGPSAGMGNLISGNSNDGVFLGNNGGGNPSNNTLQGNLIGTDVSGSAALGNSHNGVEITSGALNTLVGGTSAGMGNVVAANGGDGVQITGQFTANNMVQGNFLGTNAAGTGALGNSFAGVAIFNAAHDNLVGGTTGVNPGGRLAGARNLISGNGTDGVFMGNFGVGGAHNNTVQGNYIGTDVNGAAALGNGAQGVEFNSSLNNLVGGTTAAARNVIAASAQNGVYFQSGATGNTVQGNFIGTNAAGTGAGVLAVTGSNNNQVLNNTIANNTAGVSLDASVGGWTIQSNVIALNGHSATPGNSGVIIGGGQSNAIRANSIYGNAFLGIDLGNDGVTLNNTAGHTGANLFQNFPVLTSASTTGGNFTVGGTLSSSPNTTYALDFFANAAFGLGGFGQGQTYLGSATVTTDAGGNANFSFTAPLVSGQTVITATATDPSGNTSEFSHGLSLLTSPGVPVTATEGAAFTAPVATFSDPDSDPATSFTAVIDWGDNHTSAGVVTASGGNFTVSGSHTYAEEGSFSVRVTITDADGAATSTGSTATVSDAALSAAAVNVSATEGLGFSAVVATFTDANPGAAASDFSATITWGDGTSSSGSVSANGGGGFLVTGGHTYADEGSYAVHVTISDIGHSSASVSGSATVADAALTVTGASVTATEGATFSGVVATFSDANPGAAAGDFSATIAWGDGQTSAGTVSANGGGFSVNGMHAYASSGPYTIRVNIVDVGSSTATATSNAAITDAALTATAITFSAAEGAAFSGVVASFTDANPLGTAGNFSATIAWGDGSSSAGTVSANSSGGFQVTGGHTYAEEGSYAVHVTINDVGGAAAAANSTAIVADAAVTAAGATLTATEGAGFSGVVATFTDANPLGSATEFSATITWGDGTTSSGSVSANGSGFQVSGSHTYADEGSYVVHVTINDAGGSTASANGSASVADAALAAAGTSVGATEGAAFSGVVATFTDANPGAKAGEFTATITWGDGAFSTGTVSASGGGFQVSGSHTYVDQGSYAVRVTINDVGGSSASAISTANVGDAALTGAGTSIGATEGAAFSGVVATFTDANPNAGVSDFSAIISWGDGTTSSGNVTLANGVFGVSAPHTYADDGPYAVSVTVADDGPYAVSVTVADVGGSMTTVGGTATVGDAPLAAAAPGTTISATEGAGFSGVVATFTDANPGSAASDFSATITWGDGSTSAGVVTLNSAVFSITGAHTFAQEGSYAVHVTVSDIGGSSASAATTATVADAALTAAGAAVTATEGAAFSGVVATFTDANSGAAAGEFTATITWGDGATSAGSVSATVGGGFEVSGSHTYADEGSYAVRVIINDAGGSTASANGSASVADAALAAAGTSVGATEGAGFSGVVASFTDANPNAVAGEFSATITWGDGTASAGTVSANGTGFQVTGAHTYVEEGSYAAHVTVSDIGSSSASATTTATVADAALTAAGVAVAATEGAGFSGVVATFTEANPNAAVGDFSAIIAWGDGTTSSGNVTLANGVFSVNATHTYADDGSYAISVTVADFGGSSTTAHTSAAVADAALTAAGKSISATEGAGFSGVVATFTDANPNAAAGDFTATITWGDGTTSAGTVSLASGIFSVSAAHTYADEGSHAVTVAINDVGGSTATAHSSATVADAALTAAGVAISATAGTSFSGVVATFTDANPNAAASEFSATISWGDGQTSAGTVAAGTVGFSVTGTHTYAAAGSFAVTVTVADVGGRTATANSTAAVTGGLSAQANSFSAVEGFTSGTVPVATFRDPSGARPATQYQAQIAWGDGSSSAGTIVANTDGSFSVRASHTYADEGTYTVAVHITRDGSASADATGKATVADAALTATGVNLPETTVGRAFSGVVAKLTDGNPGATAADFTATIGWGDGATSAGTVQSDGHGGFVVLGSHTYAVAGHDTVTVSITDDGGSKATARSTLNVEKDSSMVVAAQTATAAFWQAPQGQTLLTSFNGGAQSTALSSWLATTFVNLFGAKAAYADLGGKTNAQVAKFFRRLFDDNGRRPELQFLAAALNVYATAQSLGGSAGKAFGFKVDANGLGAATFNVRGDGGAVGVANGSEVNVMRLLKDADARAIHGWLDRGRKELRHKAEELFRRLNHAGQR